MCFTHENAASDVCPVCGIQPLILPSAMPAANGTEAETSGTETVETDNTGTNDTVQTEEAPPEPETSTPQSDVQASRPDITGTAESDSSDVISPDDQETSASDSN